MAGLLRFALADRRPVIAQVTIHDYTIQSPLGPERIRKIYVKRVRDLDTLIPQLLSRVQIGERDVMEMLAAAP